MDKLREFCHAEQARGKQVKIYYTIRELTTHLPYMTQPEEFHRRAFVAAPRTSPFGCSRRRPRGARAPRRKPSYDVAP